MFGEELVEAQAAGLVVELEAGGNVTPDLVHGARDIRQARQRSFGVGRVDPGLDGGGEACREVLAIAGGAECAATHGEPQVCVGDGAARLVAVPQQGGGIVGQELRQR